MARRKRRKGSKKKCAGLKRNGKLKKGYKWKRGGGCPIRARGKR